jgi:hypothetical protein
MRKIQPEQLRSLARTNSIADNPPTVSTEEQRPMTRREQFCLALGLLAFLSIGCSSGGSHSGSGGGGAGGSSAAGQGGDRGAQGGGTSGHGGDKAEGGASGSGVGGAAGAGGAATGGSSTTASGSGGTGAGGKTVGGTGGAGKGGGGVSGEGGGGGQGGVGSGGTTAGGGGQSGASCSISIKTKTLSTVIPTVGIVEFSTDLAGLTDASIEFGLDTQYGMTAPVDLKEANYRTLILGMKAGGNTYHFRIVAKAGDKVCTGQDNTLPATGDPPTSLPQLSFSPSKATGLSGGFLVFETLKQTFGSGVPDSPAYIVDGDGDFVWWYTKTGIIDVGRVRQSYDGKYMWIAAVNVLSG